MISEIDDEAMAKRARRAAQNARSRERRRQAEAANPALAEARRAAQNVADAKRRGPAAPKKQARRMDEEARRQRQAEIDRRRRERKREAEKANPALAEARRDSARRRRRARILADPERERALERDRSRRAYLRNPERARAKVKRWRRENPDWVAALETRKRARRALRSAARSAERRRLRAEQRAQKEAAKRKAPAKWVSSVLPAEARARVLRENVVYATILRAVSTKMDPHIRDDVISELFVMVLEGSISLDEVPAHVRKVSGALRRDEWATVSIDAPLRGAPEKSLHDVLTTEHGRQFE